MITVVTARGALARIDDDIRCRSPPRKTIVLLCGKCARKMDGGYGPQGKDTLRSILREAIREAGHRRDVRVVDARCLGICPRKAVTVINASNPGMVFIVPAGMSSARALKLVIGPAD